MFNRPNRNEVDESVDDINHDVNQLADTLEEVLKSFGSDVKEEGEAARKKAESLLKETRARIQGRGRVKQAACNAISCADTYVRDKPWHSVGISAAVGIFLGALLVSRR
ncbi:DUF883 family protein [Enterobacteriaceae bacterium H20N1]|uniref:DUF883 family protein n=1 Tax=Dryocola boscaweniae TaxID=2925397 RepID=A0A9X2W8Q2_9ENTR|nr:DUF883 family protein [Dryocola boscaweniae]MCT4702870.1 DUF883 family protein [Dryocola boscaweniae]MCT4715339.1 DUF883 family protein [Dryocola boscaweniae]MCT4720038.1 DUF883 family protein [Dryocola boscaweniae]